MPDQVRERAVVVVAYDRMMREQVAPGLRAAGFTGTLRSFTIRRGTARCELRWQKDGRDVRAGRLSFTANLDWRCGGGRVYKVLPAPAHDTWWDLNDGEPTEPVADAVVTVVLRYVLPAFLAGLDAPGPVTDDRMYDAWPSYEPDAGGSAPVAAYIQPRETQYDWAFAAFASHRPADRIHGAYGTALAPDDPRTVPALLSHLEHDPDPVVRMLIASRVLTTHRGDSRVIEALDRTVGSDAHDGVRWAGRFALRVLQAQV